MADAAIEKVMAAVAAQPLAAANSVPSLIAKLADPAAHGQEALVNVIVTLQLFFADALGNGGAQTAKRRKGLPHEAGESDAAAVYAGWLARQRAAFEQRLLALLAGPDSTLQVAALQAVMSLLQQGQQRGTFDVELFRRALAAALGPALSGSLLGVLTRKYMAHTDVRYHTLMAVQSLAAQLKDSAANGGGGNDGGGHAASGVVGSSRGGGGGGNDSRRNAGSGSSAGGGGAVTEAERARPLLEVLLHAPPTPPAEDFPDGVTSWSGAAEAGTARAAASGQRRKRKAEAGGGDGEAVRWLSWEHQRRAFANAWLAVLRCELPAEAYHQVLVRMHSAVIPAMPNPLLLADFLSASVDQGGMTGMLALNGLFILVTKHGLEYPAFYRRLYGLLTLDTFQAKQRVQFFQLADVFLASGMVPAYTAAAFVKKFARLALRTTPAGAVICLAFMHNLLRRHPATTQLLHRPPPKPRAVEEEAAAAADSADAAAPAAIAAAAQDIADPVAGAGHAAAAPAPAAMPAPAAARDPAVTIAGRPTRSGGRTAAAVAAAADPAAVGASAAAAAPARANGLANGTASAGGSGSDGSSGDGSFSDDEAAAEVVAAASGSLPARAAQASAGAAAEAGSAHPGADPYDEAEPDPARCRALESSLWEITALQAHYDPQVANFTSILDKDLSDRRRTAEMDIQPLLTDSYTGRIKAELGKRLKAAPTAFYAEPPKSLFAANVARGPLPGWDFSV